MPDHLHAIAPGTKRRRKKKPVTDQGQAHGGRSPQAAVEAGTTPLAQVRPAGWVAAPSSFVFLWWPQQRKVEALPTANVSRIESVPPLAVARPVAKPATTKAPAVAVPGSKP